MNPQKLANPMRRIRLEKLVVNIGVGTSGEKLEKAMKVLEMLTRQKPVKTIAKKTAFGAKRGEPIGCKVTLRKSKAIEFLKRALKVKRNRLSSSWFDSQGNFSFGIPDHTLFGIKYDPEIGIFGMDICISLERPGYRVSRRRRARAKIPPRHRITKQEAIQYIAQEFGVEIV